eukprot:229638-Rhodomonas_salina.1
MALSPYPLHVALVPKQRYGATRRMVAPVVLIGCYGATALQLRREQLERSQLRGMRYGVFCTDMTCERVVLRHGMVVPDAIEAARGGCAGAA